MRVLYLEDSLVARRTVLEYFRDRIQIDFVADITAMDELLYDNEGYKQYDAIVVDLSINMPDISKKEIVDCIPALNVDGVPTHCVGVDIPLYGLDYYKLVIAERRETKTMVDDGRVILFSGHAAKVRSHGLYDESDPLFAHTKLFDRSDNDENSNATTQLYSLLQKIKQRM